MAKLRLRVVTPEKTKFDDDVNMVIVRCVSGDWGILPGHEAYSAALGYGVLRIIDESGEHRMAIFGGIARVMNNVVTILTQSALWPDDIDLQLAEEEQERIRRRMKMHQDSASLIREQAHLRRTLVKIEVSSYPLISPKPQTEYEE